MYRRETDYDDFNIVLFSNDSLNFFPENTLSGFTNRLNNPCKLEGGTWYVGLAEISFNGFRSSSVVNDEEYKYNEQDLGCIPRKRLKRSNFTTGKIKIDITDDEAIEFSYKDLVDVHGQSSGIAFDSFLKNLDIFVVKPDLKPLGEVKAEIRKQFDNWIVGFQNDSTKHGRYVQQGNVGPDNTCVLDIYSHEKVNLTFPRTYKDISTFLDYIFYQVPTNKRSLDKLEELFDIFLVYHSNYKQSKNFNVLVPAALTNVSNDSVLQNTHKTLIAAVNPQPVASHSTANQQPNATLQMTNTLVDEPVPDDYLFVYLDIIAPRRIGSRNNRVLKILRSSKKSFHFSNIEYVRLEKCNFDSISVLLTYISGEQVDFVSSKMPTYVNLHFKHVSHF